MVKTIIHQLPNNLPDYPTKILLLGTFNPKCGETVLVHYGRKRNKTWPILSAILKENFDPNSTSIHQEMKEHGIACVDIVQSVDTLENLVPEICGKGYSDAKLFANSITKNYIDIENLNAFINKNKGICVFSTWGKGSSLSKDAWNFIRRINQLHPLVSPSLAAKVPIGERKLEYMIRNWTACINSCRQKK
jgi:hypothetical protein